MAKKDGFELEGLEEVLRNLNQATAKIKNAGKRGLLKSAMFIRNDMTKTAPKVPVDTRNLEASWQVNRLWPGSLAVEMGFWAKYAVHVHENTEADFTSTRIRYRNGKKYIYKPRPGAGPKFLEKALYRNTDEILEILRSNIVNDTTKGGYR